MPGSSPGAFSGDKEQLLPLIKAGLSYKGFAVIDVISPCVTFNDHEGSTKSYEYTRQHFHPALQADYVPPSEEIKAQYNEGEAMPVTLHDGSQIVLRKVKGEYDPTDRASIYSYLEKHQQAGEVITGLLYYDDSLKEMHDLNNVVDEPLSRIDYGKLCPGDGPAKITRRLALIADCIDWGQTPLSNPSRCSFVCLPARLVAYRGRLLRDNYRGPLWGHTP